VTVKNKTHGFSNQTPLSNTF